MCRKSVGRSFNNSLAGSHWTLKMVLCLISAPFNIWKYLGNVFLYFTLFVLKDICDVFLFVVFHYVKCGNWKGPNIDSPDCEEPMVTR